MEYVLRLACIPMLPFDFMKFTEVVKKDIVEIKKVFPEHLFTVHLYKLEEEIDELEKKLIEINKLSREYGDQYNPRNFPSSN